MDTGGSGSLRQVLLAELGVGFATLVPVAGFITFETNRLGEVGDRLVPLA